MLERLVEGKLVRRQTLGGDATTLEVNAAMRSLVRWNTGKGDDAFVNHLSVASGVETPTRADGVRFDRKRMPKKTSSKEWMSAHDPDAKITKLTDGRTHLADSVEEDVDLEMGEVLVVTVPGEEMGDTHTLAGTLTVGREEVETVAAIQV